jgi:hypothetical protein
MNSVMAICLLIGIICGIIKGIHNLYINNYI